MFAPDFKAVRLASFVALAAAAAAAPRPADASVAITWDLTAPPDTNDAANWLLLKPDNTSAPAVERFLGHTATYVSGGVSLTVNAFYVLPTALGTFETAFLHRATGTNSALGVCDFRALNFQQSATMCGTDDSSLLDGVGNIDILRLTLPPLAAPTSATLLAFGPNDAYRIYCSDNATIDLGDDSALAAGGGGAGSPLTVQLGSNVCDKSYIFVTPGTLTGLPGPDGFRLAELSILSEPEPVVIPAPSALSLLPAWLLGLTAIGVWSRRVRSGRA